MQKILLLSAFIQILFTVHSQAIDVKKYDLVIEISDSSNAIKVTEIIDFVRMSKMSTVQLELVSLKENGEGMKVHEVMLNQQAIPFNQGNDYLSFEVDNSINANRTNQVKIVFSGIPADGLIIGENKFGNRTFFGDNWPNRAHHWFACNDHPSDKALIDFSIIAPSHYEIIANGEFKGKVEYNSGLALTSYSSTFELPTKVMVFGAADFAVEELKEFTRFPLSSWVYPENEKAGFKDMKLAIEVLDFFEAKIAEYPYEKLANVQSTTRYGGMENAGCIFYAERAIRGDGMMEELIAHEIAHQWFGNSATESDWEHLWLSEGFATYMTHLYIENKYGEERFKEELGKDRQTVFHFYDQHVLPVVDTLSTDLLFRLNANAYQRGAWVLHMLRSELGTDAFWKGIQQYYSEYDYSNATTDEFIEAMEQSSGKDLSQFTTQWLRTGVLPELKLSWKLKRKKATFELTQVQKGYVFQFPIDLTIEYVDGTSETIVLNVNSEKLIYTMTVKSKIKHIELDRNKKILFH